MITSPKIRRAALHFRIWQLNRLGTTLEDIALDVNCTPTSVRRICAKRGWPVPRREVVDESAIVDFSIPVHHHTDRRTSNA